MEESEEKKSIELLPEEKFEEYSLPKKLTTWIINIGRVIIIVTELIAFSVFVGRIKLDRELTDLTEALENQLVILDNAQEFETNFRDTQTRLTIIKELKQRQAPSTKILAFFSSTLPKAATLTGLTLQPNMDKNESYLMAKTDTVTGFARAVHQLKDSPQTKEIALTSGRFSAKDGVYRFSLAIRFVEGAFE